MSNVGPDNRLEPPHTGGERESLTAFLDYHRQTLLWKISGLDEAQLKQRAVPASNLTLLGLVRHLTEVERGWFAELCGLDDSPLYCTEDRPDGDFDDVADADAAADLAAYQAEIAAIRKAVADLPLDAVLHEGPGREFSLRWIMLHMIEEYARHNGHADLLRESIDGATGE